MCGIVGVWGNPQAAFLVKNGLFAIQHRGQESAGIVDTDGASFQHYKGMGLIDEVFTQERINSFVGYSAIGHVRYSTRGDSIIQNAQPHHERTKIGEIWLASNGDLVNFTFLRNWLEDRGKNFYSENDGEILVKLIGYFIDHGKTLIEAVKKTMKMAKGAFSALLIDESGDIAAFRDPFGFRPLVKGGLGNSKVFASETCALDIIGAQYKGEVNPGEIIFVKDGLCQSYRCDFRLKSAKCVFELIYFSRPDSTVFGKSGERFRRQSGRQLAKECPAKADIVIPVPDSSNYIALGYAEESGIQLDIGLVRSHYVHRTFIQPLQEIRDDNVFKKFGLVKSVLKNKKVVLVDDSIVRGTTLHKLVQRIRRAGAIEVHVRIASPPIRHSCFYGIDTPNETKLAAYNKSITEICRSIEADSLGYLSLKGLREVIGGDWNEFCYACFNGNYPVL